MKRVVVFLLMALATRMAWAGEVDPEHFGIWAPVGKSCKSEPRIEVSAKEIAIYHQGRVQRFGDLEEFVDCNSGSANDSISSCVHPNWNSKNLEPFQLFFNYQEDRRLMQFEVTYGDINHFPKSYTLFTRCSKMFDGVNGPRSRH